MKIPEVGLIACNSGASNTGTLTGLAVLRIARELGKDKVGICSLPALANLVPRQISLVKQVSHLIVLDGCHQQCGKKLVAQAGISFQGYLNLEEDLGVKKLGPFSTLEYADHELTELQDAIRALIDSILNKK